MKKINLTICAIAVLLTACSSDESVSQTNVNETVQATEENHEQHEEQTNVNETVQATEENHEQHEEQTNEHTDEHNHNHEPYVFESIEFKHEPSKFIINYPKNYTATVDKSTDNGLAIKFDDSKQSGAIHIITQLNSEATTVDEYISMHNSISEEKNKNYNQTTENSVFNVNNINFKQNIYENETEIKELYTYYDEVSKISYFISVKWNKNDEETRQLLVDTLNTIKIN